MSMSIRALGAILVGFGAGGTALAQCPPFLQPFDSKGTFPGVEGIVYCSTMWDPDGAGPRSPVLVIGGNFRMAGGIETENIAAFDPETETWTAFAYGLGFFRDLIGTVGTDPDTAVYALQVLPSGELLAGGRFDLRARSAGLTYTDAQCLAKWNAATKQWEPVGTFSASPIVRALALHPDGTLFVGGEFAGVDGVGARCVARWLAGRFPGTSEPWMNYGGGLVPGDSVRALHCMSDGNTYAGGNLALGNFAKINFSWPFSWEVAGGGTDGTVESLDEYNGQLLVSGTFVKSKGASPVELNGIGWYRPFSGWSALGTGMVGSSVHAARTLSNGQVIAAGDFSSAGGVPASGVARWNGSAWSATGVGVNSLNDSKEVYTIALKTETDFFVGGEFRKVGRSPANNVARCTNEAWKPLHPWIDAGGPVVYAVRESRDGFYSVFAAGDFANVAGITSSNIVRFDLTEGGQFGVTTLGKNSLAGGTNGPIFVMESFGGSLDSAAIVAAGQFTSAGGVSVNNIALWNGTAWQPLGSGLNGPVYAMIAKGPNDILAAGDFSSAGGVPVQNIAFWNGSSWSAPGNSGTNGPVRSLFPRYILSEDGSAFLAGYYVGGSFTRAGWLLANRFAFFDGLQWRAPSTPSTLIQGEVRSMGILDIPPINGRTSYLVLAQSKRSQYLESYDEALGWVEIRHGGHSSPSNPNPNPFTTSEPIRHINNDWTDARTTYDGAIARWSPTLGNYYEAGTNGPIFSLSMKETVRLYACGDFLGPRGTGTAGVFLIYSPYTNALNSAAIDGQYGLSSASNEVRRLFTLNNGDLLISGNFESIGGVRANRIARWGGSAWSALGSGLANTFDLINGMAQFANGDLVVGGGFTSIGGTPALCVARWNGSAWSALGGGFQGGVNTLLKRPNGDLVAGGNRMNDPSAGMTLSALATWNGSSWTRRSIPLNTTDTLEPIQWVYGLANMPNGDLIVAGQLPIPNGPANAVLRWNGTAWSMVGGQMNGKINALAVLPNGDIVVGGEFTNVGGVAMNRIARWNGAAWSSMGTGFSTPVRSLQVRSSGQIVAVCDENTVTGSVLQWTGTAWTTIAFARDATCLAELLNGDLVIGGNFQFGTGLNGVSVFSQSLLRYSSTGANVAITSQPAGSTICDSIAASVAVGADSNAPMNYQWQVQAAPGTWVNASNSTTLPCGGRVSVASPTSKSTQVSITRCPGVAQYQLRCLVSNSCSTITSNSVTIKLCLADLDCNMYVDDSDFVQFARAYDTLLCDDPAMPAGCHADLNGDNYVDDADFVQFASAYDQLECN